LGLFSVPAPPPLALLTTNCSDSTVPFWDGLTTALSLGAQWPLVRKYVANWYLWIATDVLSTELYLYKDLRLTALLYAGFLGLCVLGLRQWQRSERLVLAA
jgi:nicotinamide mononucleotide transporter